MITNQKNNLDFEIVDSTTVHIFQGAARVGNTVMPYQGGRISFSEMSDLISSGAVKYQNSLLYIQNTGGAPDMTTARSTKVSSQSSLTLPVLPTDSSHPYSPTHPIGLFTFYSPDSTQINLINQYKI